MELVIDEPQNMAYRRQLLSSYNLVYAREILNELWDVIIEQCNGCAINHPSQCQHTCIMLTELEHLELYFELVWMKVNVDDVIAKWKEEIKTLNIPQQLKDTYSQFLQCKEWRKCNVEQSTTLNTQYYLTEKMLKLERRLFE